MMKYTHIQPHPVAEDGKMHKVPASCPPAHNPELTQSVLRRNARERKRVKEVNDSFARLRHHLPQAIIAELTKGGGRGPEKKISKVDTLRVTVEYIKRLHDCLTGATASSEHQQQNQQFDSQSNTNCDSASNSSYCSSLSTSSSPIPYTSVYYNQPASPLLSSLWDANLQGTTLNNAYNNSTTFLSPVSLNSHSPPHQNVAQLENSEYPTSSTSFNSNITFESPIDAAATAQPMQQHFQQNEQTTPPHFDGNFQFKFEPSDNIAIDRTDCPPDDEAILDYICLWEEQK